MGNQQRRLTSVIVREVDGECLVLDTETNQVHRLNATAAFIWQCCDESASADDVAASLVRAFHVDADVALADVKTTLEKFRALNLIAEV